MGKSALEARISDAHYAAGTEYERTSKVFTRRLVPSERALRILDVGCGTGLNARHLAAMGHTVVGIDVSAVAIEKLRQAGFEGVVCDLERDASAPFPAASFDLIFASEVIEHIADTAIFLAELNRLIGRGGMLVLSTPNSAWWPYRLLGLAGRTVSETQHPGHVRFFTRRSLARAVESAGFAVEAMSARHMYVALPATLGDPLAPALKRLGFATEPRFATGGYFWQLSRFARHASPFWADTLIVIARKP